MAVCVESVTTTKKIKEIVYIFHIWKIFMNNLFIIKIGILAQCRRKLTTVSHVRGKKGAETPLEGC